MRTRDAGTAHATFGHVDIVVTNAGIVRWGPLSDLTEDDFDAVFRVNTKGTFFALREAARTIENGGRIINIASSATALTLPGLALYTASKAASAQFAKILAKETRHSGRRRRTCRGLAASGSRRTSPTSWPFWPATMRAGLPVRTSRQAADWCIA